MNSSDLLLFLSTNKRNYQCSKSVYFWKQWYLHQNDKNVIPIYVTGIDMLKQWIYKTQNQQLRHMYFYYLNIILRMEDRPIIVDDEFDRKYIENILNDESKIPVICDNIIKLTRKLNSNGAVLVAKTRDEMALIDKIKYPSIYTFKNFLDGNSYFKVGNLKISNLIRSKDLVQIEKEANASLLESMIVNLGAMNDIPFVYSVLSLLGSKLGFNSINVHINKIVIESLYHGNIDLVCNVRGNKFSLEEVTMIAALIGNSDKFSSLIKRVKDLDTKFLNRLFMLSACSKKHQHD
jgi:hypothetical protein